MIKCFICGGVLTQYEINLFHPIDINFFCNKHRQQKMYSLKELKIKRYEKKL